MRVYLRGRWRSGPLRRRVGCRCCLRAIAAGHDSRCGAALLRSRCGVSTDEEAEAGTDVAGCGGHFTGRVRGTTRVRIAARQSATLIAIGASALAVAAAVAPGAAVAAFPGGNGLIAFDGP